jgi:hypothetical protein
MLLDTLVKLASLGTSGICIFGIFWIGYLILNPPKKSDPQRPGVLKFFMASCIAIALIAAAGNVFSAWYEKKQLAQAISIVLRSKEAYQLEHPSPELERYINQLKSFAQSAEDK